MEEVHPFNWYTTWDGVLAKILKTHSNLDETNRSNVNIEWIFIGDSL
jgi:hypothetical protein